MYSGGSIGDGANGYIGGVVALPGDRLGDGFAVRGGASGGTYRYESADATIRARYVGAEIAVVYQFSGEWGWANVSAGPRVTDTSLSPNDPNNRLRGTRFDGAVQTDGAIGQNWRASWFASLGVNNRTYITTVRVGPLVDGERDVRLGLEGGVQGDRTYTRRSAGAFASARLSGNLQGLVSGGVLDQAGRSVRPYATIGLSRVF